MIQQYSDSTLYINLDAIRHNYNFFKGVARNSEVASVVKANCYGLGIGKVVPALEEAGCKIFFVATLDEAIELKSILSKHSDLYAFHGIKKNELEEFENKEITPVINCFSQLELYSSYARQVGKKLPCIIHFDTGMNRLGINYTDAQKVKNSSYIQNLEVKYLMSHLSCVSDAENPLNDLQYQRMKEIKRIFPEYKISLCNSRGAISSHDYHFDLIRPGSGLYGICAGFEANIANVISVKAKVIQVRDVQEGGYVGYGATASVKKGGRLAIIPVGYADGYLRSLSNKSCAYYKGYRLPLLGIVSMDMTIFDISAIPTGEIDVGDEVELIGENVLLHEVSQASSTIGYELLTRLGSRYKRVYI